MKKVLFITDECDLPKDYSIKSKNSEGNKASARNEMVNALNNLFDYVYTTYSISEANKYLVNNKDTYVVTTYYGIAEASSKSIIPAICKAENVNYLGADAYAQMICNDKYLSKSYIKKFGLNPIPGIIIYSPNNREELNEIQKLNYPLVVKPNFGGGSNGIAKCSVTYNFEQTITLIEELSNYQNMPILVEEYIEGYEISFIIIGNKNKIKYSGESKLLLDKKDYFTNEVFGLESKKINASQKAYVASNFIKGENKNKIFNLFKSFEKMEFMRVDCRVTKNQEIYVIELSTDCYIGSNGAFQETLKRDGYDFFEMLKFLINNSTNNQNNLLSNDQ